MPGTFVLDTGASFVSLVGASFAKKAKIEIEQGSSLRLHTANGIGEGQRGRADTIQLRLAQGQERAGRGRGRQRRGLWRTASMACLGLSFLSRFNVTIDGKTVRIAPNKPK